MEERYWLRHESLRSVVGPYSLVELRMALAAGSFPRDSEVLLFEDQAAEERDASTEWQPIAHLFGEPTPPLRPRTKPSERDVVLGRLWIVRDGTRYATARTLVNVCAMLGILAQVVTMIAVLSQGRMLTFGMVALTLASTAFSVMMILVGATALQALFDLADCSLRQDARDDDS